MATEADVLEMLTDPIRGIRQRRRYTEQGWLLNYRAWQGWPVPSNVQPLLDGSARYFVPHVRRVIERNVARRTKLLMPVTDWFETLPLPGMTPNDSTEDVHALMSYVYEKKLQSRRVISSLCRCAQLYNFSVLQTSVRVVGREVWPYQRAVDPFNFYVFPDTATNRDDASMVFEDVIVPWPVYDSFVNHDEPEQSIYKPVDASELARPVWPYHMVERLAYKGLSMPDDVFRGGSDRQIRRAEGRAYRQAEQRLQDTATAFVQLTKCNFRQGSKWFYAVICWNSPEPWLVRFDEEAEEPLVQWSTTRPIPGELYTASEVDDVRVLQQLCNSALSQIEANREKVADPPIAVDISAGGDRLENYTFENRRLWRVNGDPNAIFKDIPVGDVGQGGLRAMQIYLGLLNAVSGGAQIAEGEPGRNMPRSGAIGGSLLNLALADTEYAANVEEEELLTPGLADVYRTLVEIVPPSQIFRIPGRGSRAARVLSHGDIMGAYSFLWQGNLAYESTQERAAKLMQFAGLLLQPNVLPVLGQQLAEQGLKVDWVTVFRTIYTYGLGERGLGEIIAPMTPQEQQQYQQQQQQAQQMQQAQVQQQQAAMQQQQQTGQARIMDITSRARERQAKMQLEAARAQREGVRTQQDVQSGRVQDHVALGTLDLARQKEQRERLALLLPLMQAQEDEGNEAPEPGSA